MFPFKSFKLFLIIDNNKMNRRMCGYPCMHDVRTSVLVAYVCPYVVENLGQSGVVESSLQTGQEGFCLLWVGGAEIGKSYQFKLVQRMLLEGPGCG